MRLLRFGGPGAEKLGVQDTEGRIRNLPEIIPDVAGSSLLPASLHMLRGLG